MLGEDTLAELRLAYASHADMQMVLDEVDRLATALTDAADRLGDLSSVLSRSNRASRAVQAWEWSKEARAVLLD